MVWKGFTSGEFLLAAIIGLVAGIPLAVPLALVPFIGLLAFPTCMLLMPLIVIFMGGGWIAGYKRGKPENYIWQRLEEIRCRARLSRSLVLDSRAWELKRTRAMPQRGER